MAFNDFNISIRIFFLLFFNIALAQVETIDTSVSKNDTVTVIQPIVKTDVDAANDTVKKERLQGILDYDSYDQFHDYKNQHTYLVTDAIVKYLDMEIQADYIDINWNTGDIYAVGKEDSLGNIVEPSRFKQGNKEIEYNSFSFNINTKRVKNLLILKYLRY